MTRFRGWVEAHVGLTVMLFFLAGLVLPGLSHVPDDVILPMIGSIIFFAASKIKPEDLHDLNWAQFGGFYLIRFCLLPIALYYTAVAVLPASMAAPVAVGVLLIALMPAGSTVPAIASVFGGNAGLGLGITALSSLLAPLVVPLVFLLVTGEGLAIDRWGMFLALAAVILIPCAVYALIARPVAVLRKPVQHYASMMSILLIGCVIAIVVGKQRHAFLGAPDYVLVSIGMQSALAFLFYAFGWFWGQPGKDGRLTPAITYAVGAGVMNISIGIGLAFAFFEDQVVLFMVLGEIPWVLALPLFRRFLVLRGA